MAQSSSKDDFIAGLKEKNIDLVLRHTEDGRIYGATFIDHNTMTVLNGSRLGKEFSANALDRLRNPSYNLRHTKARATGFSFPAVIIMHRSLTLHVRNVRPHIRTVRATSPETTMTPRCSTGWAVCSVSARPTTRRRKPSTARCSAAEKRRNVARVSDSLTLTH